MKKIDFKQELKKLYQASAKDVAPVNVPAMDFLMVEGQGDPNTSQDYVDAIEALFSVAYALKFTIKKGALAMDYAVMPLECMWWAEDMDNCAAGEKSVWKWTAMIMQPPFITSATVYGAIAEVQKKKPLAALSRVHLNKFSEGKCAQILHIGPFSQEAPTIKKVHQFIQTKTELRGKHHEIYLSDIRKAAPDKWKTIIRQPMQ
jgi:hypothetical protein